MSNQSDAFEPEINAITLFTGDMAASVAFYRTLGMVVVYGGPDAEFTSLSHGRNYVNLSGGEGLPAGAWGRVVFHVESPDSLHTTLIQAGYMPQFEPTDAPWGERYFHVNDPDGHELSFARRLD